MIKDNIETKTFTAGAPLDGDTVTIGGDELVAGGWADAAKAAWTEYNKSSSSTCSSRPLPAAAGVLKEPLRMFSEIRNNATKVWSSARADAIPQCPSSSTAVSIGEWKELFEWAKRMKIVRGKQCVMHEVPEYLIDDPGIAKAFNSGDADDFFKKCEASELLIVWCIKLLQDIISHLNSAGGEGNTGEISVW